MDRTLLEKVETWADQVADSYQSKPVLHSLVQWVLGLFTSGACSALEQAFRDVREKLKEQQTKTFFDELSKKPELLTEENVKKEEFVHRTLITIRAVSFTRHQEKIRIFARLLSGSIENQTVISDEQYEEYLSIINDLSWTEIRLLTLLEKYEKENSFSGQTRTYEDIKLYWDKFEAEVKQTLGFDSVELKIRLGRLERSGCYWVVKHLTWDKTITVGKLTSIYFDIKKIIQTFA